jgi:NAD(P)-dependent dehydrogenase (short-subunit alcohol dehydrogenase family)
MSNKYLIFGATGSIGSSLAEQLTNSDHEVHLIARNEDELKPLSEKLGCTYSVADVLEENFIDKVKADTSDFDVKGVAYCVGSIDLKPLKRVSESDLHNCMKLNLYSAIESIKGFQEELKKNNGSIVLFSSVAAQKGFTNHIAPSLTNSKISQSMLKSPVVAEALAKAHPLKRLGEGEDSAALAKFLLSDESSWVTGQIIGVDGGRSALS